MKFKQILPTAITGVLLCATFAVCAFYGYDVQPVMNATADEPQKKSASFSAAEAAENMKGVWVTASDLSMANEPKKDKAAFEAKFSRILKDCASYGANAVIVQVRPFCDSLYPSHYFPYSHVLTGVQGKDPGYDPLEVMCRLCRKEQMAIHAWLNPYRVTLNGVPEDLSDDNPALNGSAVTLQTDSTLILDPSEEKNRKLIADGVKEILERYPVDGIQFDDYFYPEDISDEDEAQYERYCAQNGNNSMSLLRWRTANVNMLMAKVFQTVHCCSDKAVFGISPQGHLANNEKLCADVVSWCSVQGYADYVCPQLYFSPENPALSFEDALNDWTELNLAPHIKLYAGLAAYKAGTDSDEGTWENQNDILKTEVNILKKNKKISGWILFSYADLNREDAKTELDNLRNP